MLAERRGTRFNWYSMLLDRSTLRNAKVADSGKFGLLDQRMASLREWINEERLYEFIQHRNATEIKPLPVPENPMGAPNPIPLPEFGDPAGASPPALPRRSSSFMCA